jgi:methionyl-tRNA formyltransferase
LTIVFLTNGSTHGQTMLLRLRESGIGVEAIVVEHPRPESRWRVLRRSWRQVGAWDTATWLVMAVLRRLRRRPGPTSPAFDYAAYANEVHRVADFNDADTRALLERLAPDVIVLGGARILRAPVLALARWGVLNAHPGRLPEYRGVDVIAWALYQGSEPGVTVHVVDGGVDTGGIVRQRALSIRSGDTLRALRERAEQIGADLMAEALIEIRDAGRIATTSPPPGAASRQYYRMRSRLLREVERRLRERS